MPKFEPKKWDMRVRSITKVEREKEDMEQTTYKLMARDSDGVNEIVIVSASPFKGISPKDGVIQVELKQSQKSIDDFEPEDPEEPKDDE